ncbi:FAD-dependent oxidoreductase [Halobacillus sp. A1]|uniref:dihydrolipoyl dehydrogenase family protein n=1 Tax=Halobacillus sp. A1 TaxID=2880262 RepID=UPI0020A6A3B4|nr:FAD-dependent oxidoreductase [Halobacillus sp. A1]MCP3032427.1 FAD-dependent oxidoreductase [Halobacillus sp. A1]
MKYDYQIAVIGGGSGGLTVAAGAASFGASVALIERKDELGGDCLHYGCMPSKALIQAASEVQVASEQTELTSNQYDLLFKKAMNKVSEAVADVQSHDSKQRFIDMGVDIYEASAQFADNHTLKIGDRTITAKRIVIATGSSPAVPSIEGIEDVEYLTNESIFSLKERPGHLMVIGGGIIGLELANAMAHLGVKVTVVENSEYLLSKEDIEIAQSAQQILSEHIEFVTEAKVNKVEKSGGQIHVQYQQGNRIEQVEGSHLLVAVGRKPNVGTLELNKAGVQAKSGAIEVDETLRTHQSHIYAVGDCNGSMPFTHVAGMEGKIAVSNAVLGLSRKVSYNKIPWVVYTSPEIYHLGLTEEEANEKYGDQLLTFKTKLKDADRFMAERNKNGLVKVMTTEKGKIVGAHAIGAGAGEWMQEIGTLQALNKKFQTLSNVIHPYPARNNVVSQTADLYWREKLFNSKWNDAIKWYVKKFR